MGKILETTNSKQKKYKMVVIDLDGTLLNDKKQVSKRNAEVINDIYRKKGTLFVIATGRNINDITQVTETIGEAINQYVIASNGAIIKDNVKDEYVLKKYLTKTEVIETIDAYRQKNLRGLVHTYEGQLTEENAKVEIGTKVRLVKDLKTFCLENDISTTSMLTLHGEEKNLREMKEKIEVEFSELDTTDICDIAVHKGQDIYQSKYIDIMKKNSTKANAIKILSDYLHIDKEEIMVMGDGANDVNMFEMAGYKVAMGNANEDLKNKANYITDNNNQDGVAKALEKIFYKGEKEHE